MSPRRRRTVRVRLSGAPPRLAWRPPVTDRGPWQRLLRHPPRAWHTGERRRTVPARPLAVLGLAVLALAALALSQDHPAGTALPPPVPAPPSGLTAPADGATGPAAFVPVRLTIPAIHVEAAVDRVGLRADGAMEAPEDPDRAGWFDLSAPAGAVGSTVLVGHRDRADRRALFWDLAELRPGDAVTVAGAGGRSLTYVVERVEAYPYDAVPMERLFARDRPRLALVTCAGTFDRATGNYSHRLVVYAVPAP
ncbi:MAG TPA: class F sortase [Dehalococcoidia bacterium]